MTENVSDIGFYDFVIEGFFLQYAKHEVPEGTDVKYYSWLDYNYDLFESPNSVMINKMNKLFLQKCLRDVSAKHGLNYRTTKHEVIYNIAQGLLRLYPDFIGYIFTCRNIGDVCTALKILSESAVTHDELMKYLRDNRYTVNSTNIEQLINGMSQKAKDNGEPLRQYQAYLIIELDRYRHASGGLSFPIEIIKIISRYIEGEYDSYGGNLSDISDKKNKKMVEELEQNITDYCLSLKMNGSEAADIRKLCLQYLFHIYNDTLASQSSSSMDTLLERLRLQVAASYYRQKYGDISLY